MSSIISSQPQAGHQLDPHLVPADHDDFADEGHGDGAAKLPSLAQIKRKLTTKQGWMGDYDFGFLCMPQLPFSLGKGKKKTR